MTTLHRRVETRSCVIGIDQSYTGFALCVFYADATHNISRRGFPNTKSSGVDRLADIGDWVTQTIEDVNGRVEHVCMEDYARARRNGREEAGELGAVVKLALRTVLRTDVCYPTIIAPSALKKYVTGTGKAEKSDMKLYVFKKWGVECHDDDSADAYGLARIAAAIQWGVGELSGYQTDVLNNARPHTER